MHPTGALFWHKTALLIISDAHLGKVTHFRKFGAAIPQGVITQNFDLMDQAVAAFRPETICFLGDLFHSSINGEWPLFADWVSLCGIQIMLVTGNHDIISPLRYEALGIRVVAEHIENGFLLTHLPETREGFFNLAGHIHPAVRLGGLGKQSLRLACFFKGDHQMILPAFGKFTGTHVLKPSKNDQVFAIADGSVIKI